MTEELTAAPENQRSDNPDEVVVSMEQLYLYTLNELEGNFGYLMTERFASHAIRVLLVVLSGEPLDGPSTTSMLASRRKEKVGSSNTVPPQLSLKKRTVPKSFTEAVDKFMSDAVSNIDSTYLRALATHPTGNPVLQLLLTLELSRKGKAKAKDEKSIYRQLIPDPSLEEGSESLSFLTGLLYDPVGSRLLETIIQHSPGKVFKVIFARLFQERIGVIVKNETASYVLARVLERLSREDLESAMTPILEQIPSLVERSRLSIIKIFLDRCAIRNVNSEPLVQALAAAYGDDGPARLSKMLSLEVSADSSGDSTELNAKRLHGSLLAQAMLKVPGPANSFIINSLLDAPDAMLFVVAKDRSATHVLQLALAPSPESLTFRRKILPRFYGSLGELATDANGSRVVDTLWSATQGLYFMKERFANELCDNEAALRESFYGRNVWRNWQMDLFNRRRRDWTASAKGLDAPNTDDRPNEKPKSGIEAARARYAQDVEMKHARGGRPPVLTNA